MGIHPNQQPSNEPLLNQELDSLNLGQKQTGLDHFTKEHFSPYQPFFQHSAPFQLCNNQHTANQSNQQASNQFYQAQHQTTTRHDMQHVNTSLHEQTLASVGVSQKLSSVQEVKGTTSDLAKFLVKSQLVSGGLTRFDDQPENYLGWKSTFSSVVEGLDLSAYEQIDLLIKWLGPESSQHAHRLKAVNTRHPSVGLNLIWTRLEECYGSPETIERALFSKIEHFPKIANRESHKLWELGNLLFELEAAKEDGLMYLDTARRISPIVEKLPLHLQEKWMTFGSKYKEDHNVAFPPFSVFSQFKRRGRKGKEMTLALTCLVSQLQALKGKGLETKNLKTLHLYIKRMHIRKQQAMW